MKKLALCINSYANRKQQIADNVLLVVENCDIELKIFNKLANLNQLETQITVMSELFFSQGFSLGHIIITMIIKYFACQQLISLKLLNFL